MITLADRVVPGPVQDGGEADIAAVAALLADRSRARMLWDLSDGRALTAGELARRARISPATASEHLAKLVAGGLLRGESQGRHRYFRLSSRRVATLIESIAGLAPLRAPRNFREASQGRAMHRARSCYDHMAGWLAVAITDSLRERGCIEEGDGRYRVRPQGERFFADLGVDLPVLKRQRRALARPCLDWSERRHHLAGALGAQLLRLTLERGWVERLEGTRALRVTNEGRRGIEAAFGVRLA